MKLNEDLVVILLIKLDTIGPKWRCIVNKQLGSVSSFVLLALIHALTLFSRDIMYPLSLNINWPSVRNVTSRGNLERLKMVRHWLRAPWWTAHFELISQSLLWGSQRVGCTTAHGTIYIYILIRENADEQTYKYTEERSPTEEAPRVVYVFFLSKRKQLCNRYDFLEERLLKKMCAATTTPTFLWDACTCGVHWRLSNF